MFAGRIATSVAASHRPAQRRVSACGVIKPAPPAISATPLAATIASWAGIQRGTIAR